MSEFNNIADKSLFTAISDAASFKVLYPLLRYIPPKFSGGIQPLSFFEILRIFIQQRKPNVLLVKHIIAQILHQH
ncbi:MAG: hypothetical protein KBD37_07710 [Burkholderiales bacterium]|nr:hypothetical protein [Burkholderiales bacterium]